MAENESARREEPGKAAAGGSRASVRQRAAAWMEEIESMPFRSLMEKRGSEVVRGLLEAPDSAERDAREMAYRQGIAEGKRQAGARGDYQLLEMRERFADALALIDPRAAGWPERTAAMLERIVEEVGREERWAADEVIRLSEFLVETFGGAVHSDDSAVDDAIGHLKAASARLAPGQLPPAGKGGLCLLCATAWPAPCPQHRQTIQVLELDGPPPFPRAERFDERSGQWRLAGDPRPAPWWAFWRRRGHATREDGAR